MVPSGAPFFCSCHHPHPTCHHLLVSFHNQKSKRIFAKNTDVHTLISIGLPSTIFETRPKQTITNRECWVLLGVESKHLAKRILISMDLLYKGEGKNSGTYIALLPES
jgi:hypothetical protein